MQPSTFRTIDVIALLVVVVVWGLNFFMMRYVLQTFTPFQMGAARFFFVAIPLVFIVKRPKMHWKWVVSFGLLQGLGQFGLLFTAINLGLATGLASVLLQTQVFFTAILGFMVLNERPHRALLCGLGLALAGLACFIMNFLQPGHPNSNATFLGFSLCLLGALMWAGSNLIARMAQSSGAVLEPLAFVVWSGLVPVLPFIGLSWWLDAPQTRWQWTQAPLYTWLAIAYLAWMASLLGTTLWTHLLKRYPTNQIAPFSLGVPIVGLSAGSFILHESITAWQWAGIGLLACALLCVVLVPLWEAKKAHPNQPASKLPQD